MVRAFLNTELFESIVSNDNYHFYVIHNLKSISDFICNFENVEEIKFIRIDQESFLIRLFRNNYTIPEFILRAIKGKLAWKRFFIIQNPSMKKYVKKIILMILFSCFYILTLGQFYRLVRYVFYDKSLKNFLDPLSIDGIILTCPVIKQDMLIAHYAASKHIPIIGGVDGWDTYSYINKLLFEQKAAMVWGPKMSRDLQAYHGMKTNDIIYTGIPYFNNIKTLLAELDEEKIRKKYKVKMNDKVIVLFSNNIYTTGHLVQTTLILLVEAIRNGDLSNIKIILRMLPKKRKDEEEIFFEKMAKENNDIITLQYPGNDFDEGSYTLNQKQQFLEVAEIFKIASLHMNALSMSLLEATLADVPTYLLAYKDCYNPGRFVLKEFDSQYPEQKTLWYSNQLIPNVKRVMDGDYEKDDVELFLTQWHKKDSNVQKKILEKLINPFTDQSLD